MAGCNSAFQVRFSNRSNNSEKFYIHRKADSDSEGRISFSMASNEEVEEASEANDEAISVQSAPVDTTTPTEDDIVMEETPPSFFSEAAASLLTAKPMSQWSTTRRSSLGSGSHSEISKKNLSNSSNNQMSKKSVKSNGDQDVKRSQNVFMLFLNWLIYTKDMCLGIVRRSWNGYQKISSMRVRFLLASLPVSIFMLFPNFLSGLFIGVYLSFALFFHFCVAPIPETANKPHFDEKVLQDACIKSEEEDKTGRVYKGWMNILNERYHPHRFHVNTIQTVLVRLDGNLLRISRPNRTLLKHAFHNDPTLTEPEPRMLSQNIYDLTNAKVKLRPRRLARRRWFSRKYPICVCFASSSNHMDNESGNLSSKSRSAKNESRQQVDMSPVKHAVEKTTSKDQNCHAEFIAGDDTIKKVNSGENVGPYDSKDTSSTSLNSYSIASNTSEHVSADDTLLEKMPNNEEELVETACEIDTDESLDSDSMTSDTFTEEETENAMNNQIDHSLSEMTVDSLPYGKKRAKKTTTARYKSNKRLFLFARSSREKEQWFHRLRKATSKYLLENSAFVNVANNRTDSIFTNFAEQSQVKPDFVAARRRFASMPSMDFNGIDESASKNYLLYLLTNLQFSRHIEDIIPGSAARQLATIESGGGITTMDLGCNKWQQRVGEPFNSSFIVVVNLVASRIFYDFCRDKYWIKAVQKKIQNKLATIHLPHFIETLELSSFDIGTAMPRILNVYPAIIDDWGVWIDFELKYEGRIQLMIETKVNLMKLKSKDTQQDAAHCDNQPSTTSVDNAGIPVMATMPTSIMSREPSRYSDDEIPESPETSPDEEFGSKLRLEEQNVRQKKKKKSGLLNLVDKIAQSKYFKEATDLKPIRKVLEEISSTRLILNVEVTCLEGTMTANLPTPPSDRLWYGFRKPPKMSVKAVPQVGDRSVAISVLSDWIESKIQLLLEKNLVVPNLDDVVIPVQSGNILLKGGLNL